MKLAMLTIAVLTMLTTGCMHSVDQTLTSSSTPAHAVVEFARVADTGETTVVKTVTYQGSEVRLAEVRLFKIATASPSVDQMGLPAVAFELEAAEKQAFSDWTASIENKGMVILVDGEPVMLANVNGRLPGGGVINSGAKHWTAEEVRALAARIVERR
jgi:preprotein translocase subunit SecD